MRTNDPSTRRADREWRRCVRVKARIRSPEGWRDASILNVSSRGMLIATSTGAIPGEWIELRGGDQVLKARVVWRKGQRAGLRSDEILPVLDIISLTEKPGAAGDAPAPVVACRRRHPREGEHSARWPRMLEQASTAAMGFGIAIAMLSIGATPLMARLSAITTALHVEGPERQASD